MCSHVEQNAMVQQKRRPNALSVDVVAKALFRSQAAGDAYH